MAAPHDQISVTEAALAIIRSLSDQDAERARPLPETFKDPRTGKVLENHAMISVRQLRALETALINRGVL